jgi:hypothetical protein
MYERWYPFEQRPQFSARTGGCPRFECASGGEHERDDGASEKLMDNEAAEQRQHRDNVDPSTPAQQIPNHSDTRRKERCDGGDPPRDARSVDGSREVEAPARRQRACNDGELQRVGPRSPLVASSHVLRMASRQPYRQGRWSRTGRHSTKARGQSDGDLHRRVRWQRAVHGEQDLVELLSASNQG